jgi:hypothetical protein
LHATLFFCFFRIVFRLLSLVVFFLMRSKGRSAQR